MSVSDFDSVNRERGRDTTRPFARVFFSSFLEGWGSMIKLGDTELRLRRASKNGIAEDWQKIGRDMRVAFNCVEHGRKSRD